MKKTVVMLMGLMVTLGSLQAVQPVTDNLPGLPGQSDEWWAKQRQEQAEQKKQGQFVNLREVVVKQDVAYQENESVCFYTGKPFDLELGTYIFKFRNYNPEMQRWTTMDPSGFPDGANNYGYVNCPQFELDAFGLERISAAAAFNHYMYGNVVSGHKENIVQDFSDYDSSVNFTPTNFDGFLNQFNTGASGSIDITRTYDFGAFDSGVGRVNFHLTGDFYTNMDGIKIFNGTIVIDDDLYHLQDRDWNWRNRGNPNAQRTLLGEAGTRGARWLARRFPNSNPMEYFFIFQGSRFVTYE